MEVQCEPVWTSFADVASSGAGRGGSRIAKGLVKNQPDHGLNQLLMG